MAEYPLPKFHFQVEWAGARVGFTEVSGLSVEADIMEYRDGASMEFTKVKMPGMVKFGNITLKRGMFAKDNEFYLWWKQTADLASIERRDITITLLNEKHEPVVVWQVKNAWPSKVQSTDLKSDGSEVSIETMEIVHEGLTIINE